jgi:hypothetical protein
VHLLSAWITPGISTNHFVWQLFLSQLKMASICSLEFESQIVVARSVGAVNLKELKKWVIIPLVCIISFSFTGILSRISG